MRSSLEEQVLRVLRTASMTPSELSAQLGLSRATVQVAVEQLVELGFDIPQHPLLGYTLQTSPEKLMALDIQSRLTSCWISRVEILETTASTNKVALEYGARGEDGTIAVLAEHQTAGRGRFGRNWESEAGGGIWMSLLLHPEGGLHAWPRVTTAAALAVAQSIEKTTGLQAGIKWPNDVVCLGRKVAGILAETATDPKGRPFLALGIGLNVNQSGFQDELSSTAASLRMLTGESWNRNALAAELVNCLEPLLGAVHVGFAEIVAEVKKRSSVLGNTLTLYSGSERVSGRAQDLDTEGRLILLLDDGQYRSFAAGEVSLKPE